MYNYVIDINDFAELVISASQLNFTLFIHKICTHIFKAMSRKHNMNLYETNGHS